MLIDDLARLLVTVRERSRTSFSGIGILVSAKPDDLPIAPLRGAYTLSENQSTLDALIEISRESHEHHDGFHILSPSLELLLPSQYFSPPVIPGLVADAQRRVGGRYLAALFGSALPNIVATGVASSRYGIAVFQRRQEVISRP